MDAPTITGLLETSLYVADVPRSAKFYRELFGLELMVGDERFAALTVVGKSVLLLFKRGCSTQPMATDGGVIPPHDATGQIHIAFSCAATELPAWEARLVELRIGVESRVHWDRGGDSLYFRDPDGNLLELLTPGVWPIY